MKRFWVVALLAFVHCSPRVTFELAFELSDHTTIDLSRLHLRGRAACDSEEHLPDQLQPGPADGDREGYSRSEGRARSIWFDIALEDGRPRVQPGFRASHCNVMVTAWYDADGDSQIGKGDYIGKLSPAEIRMGSMCTSALDLNNLGVLVLQKQ